MEAEEIKGKKIAIPGTLTTAFLALKIFQPDFEPVVAPFDKILDAVHERTADAGLIIHEAQLTYNKEGFHRVAGSGPVVEGHLRSAAAAGREHSAPVAAAELKSECCRMMRESIQYALDNHAEALEYAMQFARDMEPAWPKNSSACTSTTTPWTPAKFPKAVQILLDLGFEAGLIVTKKVGCRIHPVVQAGECASGKAEPPLCEGILLWRKTAGEGASAKRRHRFVRASDGGEKLPGSVRWAKR